MKGMGIPRMDGLEPRLLLSGTVLVEIGDIPEVPQEGSLFNLDAFLPDDPQLSGTYTYSWTAAKDGQVFATGTEKRFQFTPDNDGTIEVSVLVTDSEGNEGSDSAVIDVLNVAPDIEMPSGGGDGTVPMVDGDFDSGTLGPSWAVSRPDLVQVVNGQLVLSLTNIYGWNDTEGFWDFLPGSDIVATLLYTSPEVDGQFAPDGTTGVAFDADVSIVADPVMPPDPPPGLLRTTISYKEVGSASRPTELLYLFDGTTGTQEKLLPDLDKNGFVEINLRFIPGDGFPAPPATPETFTVTATVVLDNFVWLAPSGPVPVAEGDTVSITPTVTDPGADVLTYDWLATAQNGVPVATGTEETFQFVPPDNGTYDVSLTVSDGQDSDTDSMTVTVENVAPRAEITGAPATAVEGQEITLSAVVTDPGSADTFTYAWSVTKDGAPFATGGDATLAFTPDDDGTYDVSLTVTDDDGGAASASASIAVTNVAPTVAIAGLPAAAEEGQELSLSAAVSDPGAADTFTYAWEASKDGVVVATGGGADFAFTPAERGTYSISLAVTDDDGGAAAAAGDVLVVRFVEQGGAAQMEAEAYTGSAPGVGAAASSTWQPTTDLPGYSGASALIASPNVGVNVQDSTDGPRLDYEVYFQTPGTYYVWARILGSSPRDDSIHVGLNGVPATYGRFGLTDTSGFWNWEEKVVWRSGEDRVTVEVAEAGLATVNVWMREDGTGFDGLILTQDPDFVPDPLIPVGTGAPTLVETAGVVEFEAEDFTAYAEGLGPAADSSWQPTTDLAGFSGAGAMIALPDANVNLRDSDIGPRMDYAIDFTTPGTYYVWVRMLGTSGRSDSVHVGLDGVLASEGRHGVSDRSGVWHWEEKVAGRRGNQRVTVQVDEPGIHTFNLWMREDGVAVDRVLLTQDAAFRPDPLLPVPTGREAVVESGGFVEIEAELPTAVADGLGKAAAVSWVETTAVSGYSGTGAMLATPDNELNLRDSDIGPRLDYDVEISTPGTYYVWVRMLGANGRDDSVHVGVDGNPLSYGRRGVTDHSGMWHWEDRVVRRRGEDRVTFEVAEPGTYALNLWMREDGTLVDKFILTTDPAYVPDPLQPVSTGLEAYVETDGYLEFEAEDYTASAAGLGAASDVWWEETTDMEGYSGMAAMVAGPNRGLNMRDTDVGPRLDYDIEFNTTGTFYVWVRMLGTSGRDDSVHVGLDGEIASTGGTGMTDHGGEWHWEQMAGGQRVTIEVTEAGLHTFSLWMREDGTYVDKFIITTDANFTPLG